MWMKFNRCFTEKSSTRARVNPGSPRALLILSFSLSLSLNCVHTRARMTRVSAAVLTRRHAPCVSLPLLRRYARRRATCHPRVALRKTHNCHNIREYVAASRPWKDPPPSRSLHQGIGIANVLRLVNHSEVPINSAEIAISRANNYVLLNRRFFYRK